MFLRHDKSSVDPGTVCTSTFRGHTVIVVYECVTFIEGTCYPCSLSMSPMQTAEAYMV